MIIVKFQGGLGNQMFQYAFGKAMSANISKPLYFDHSVFEMEANGFSTKRKYELDLFAIAPNIADDQTIDRFIHPKSIQSLLNRMNLCKKTLYIEDSLEFDERVFTLPAPIYLDGYWQSERYFETVADQVQKDFAFKKPFNKDTELMSENLLKEANPVSVHVRRGDYITSPANRQVHGACSVDYYLQAIQLLNNTVNRPSYYFFSDDPEWVEQNLVYGLSDFQIIKHNTVNRPSYYFFSDDPEWVEQNLVYGLSDFQIIKHNGQDDSWQDMALMSKCKHHVIANSSSSYFLLVEKPFASISKTEWSKYNGFEMLADIAFPNAY